MNDNKNMILAVLLSVLVLVGWSFVSEKFLPTPRPQASQSAKPVAAGTPQTQAGQAPAAAAQLRARAQVIASTPRVRFETPSLRGSINLKGARIDDVVMLKHRIGTEANAAPVPLLSPQGARAASFIGFGWNGDGIAAPGPDTLWQASEPTLTPGKPVTLSWTSPSGQLFELNIAVDDLYLFTVTQKVTNAGSAPITLRPYGFASRAGRSADVASPNSHIGPISLINGVANYKVTWQAVREAGSQGKSVDQGTGWLGFTDKYWLTALAPKAPMAGAFRQSGNGAYQADFMGPPATLMPGQSSTFETQVFSGAKEKAALDRYENAGITKLSKSIDWGWFEWFMRPIFNLLRWLFAVTGNFGVAIICLTFIVRLIMYPIADKQFKSMAAMRKVQPKMKAIQERFKDDKPRQQQEIMQLYKTEKINPAAGCLPILLQIPIFYALYKVLLVSVEMRHKPFALWIHDLSAPDPLTPVNLFGLLHFTPPHILAIGVLPILVGATQWLTIKLSPQAMDPTQQQMMAIMPWVMVFIFAPFAAGLQLYYVTNNLLTLLQQWWLYKRYDLHFSDTHPVTT
ncbi:MAG: membrane protein insertase YidC [Sphingomicrobium sp.]